MQARQKLITVILAMAVLLISLAGCIATKRDVQDIRADITLLRMQNDSARTALQRLDSLVTVNAQADQQIISSINDLNDNLQVQLSYLLENYNTLLTEINRLRTQRTQNKAADEAAVDHACTQSFESAVALVKDKKYEDAIVALKTYLVTCSTHVSVGDANYWIGECLYSQLKFTDAIPAFESFVQTYPKSTFLSRAMYKIARCNQELDKKTEAKKRFKEIIEKFPETLEAKQSADRLKELK